MPEFNENILNPFLKVVEKSGPLNSFCINERFYTYEEFGKSVSKIRDSLKKGKKESKNIGLVANDDIETYASIFAIWLEGLAYVPLHPHQPHDRNLEIISKAGIELIIDSGSKLIFNDIRVINSNDLEFKTLDLEPSIVSDTEIAYILFTSGSTGSPKGVPVTRRNVSSFVKSFWKTGIDIDQNDRCLQCFDLTFDVSVQSFLVPLTRGACVYTIPHDQIKYSYVSGLLEDHKLTFGAMAPSMIRFLRPYFEEINIPSMRYNILTAEASPLDLINEWKDCIPNAEIFDFYGPTEATIYCTYYKYSRNSTNKSYNGLISIGKPLNGLKAVIIDEKKNILSHDKLGELCISGDQVMNGYWRNPARDAESLFEMNYEGTMRKFYRTGDSCFFDKDGDIMYAGRLDHQVKIQGYRVELGEIESHGRTFAKGQNTVAIAFSNKNGNTEIALFIEGEMPDRDGLLKYLKSKMPEYMVPSKLIGESVFPLNANGKVDRNKLKTLIQ